MSDPEAEQAEAEEIVREFARVNPVDAAAYACRYCGTDDPVDKPLMHDDDCLYARAVRWSERRWERDESWRLDALRRLDAVRAHLQQGRPASAAHVERSLGALEAGIAEANRE